MTPDEEAELFEQLQQMSRKILGTDEQLIGVKFILFFKNGKTTEYNSKNDLTLKEDRQ